MSKIYVLHNTHDSSIGGKSRYYFTCRGKLISFLKAYLKQHENITFEQFDDTPIVDAPLPTVDKQAYWNIEAEQIKTHKSFRMDLPDDLVINQRYVVFYSGVSDYTYVIDIEELNV